MIPIDRDIVNVRSGSAISYMALWQFGKEAGNPTCYYCKSTERIGVPGHCFREMIGQSASCRGAYRLGCKKPCLGW